METLSNKADNSPSVICRHCRMPLYFCTAVGRNYAGTVVQAGDMVPVSEDIPRPQNGQTMVCPKCSQVFVYEFPGYILLELENGSFWPHPPVVGRK